MGRGAAGHADQTAEGGLSMSTIRQHARQNPIGAACAAIFGIAFYVVPTWGMYGDAGWWALLLEPALFAGIGIFVAALNFVTSL